MKGILLAGGYGTRLLPVSSYCNKHLFPIYHNEKITPLIDFGIHALKDAGIAEVAIVLGDSRNEDIMAYLDNGYQYGMKFQYFRQGRPLGIAHAVDSANEFLKTTEDVIVYLGDNVFEMGIQMFIKRCQHMKPAVGCLFSEIKDNNRFGVPQFKNQKLLKVIEKPKHPPSKYALTGCYYFNTSFFQSAYLKLDPSKRGEYELTDLINISLKSSSQSYWEFYEGWWSDAGTPEAIIRLQKLLEKKTNE